MQRGHLPHAKEREAGQQRGPEIIDSEPPKVDHKPKNAREGAALRLSKPRGVDLDEARRAERLTRHAHAREGAVERARILDGHVEVVRG